VSFVSAIVLAALAIGVIPWAAGVHNHRHWIYLALVLLIVACPCALVISTPVVVTCGIAQAARLGLLIKGGSYLEVLGKVKVVALDKTGTLSEGQFRVLDIVSVDANCSVQQILYWYASLLYVVKVMVGQFVSDALKFMSWLFWFCWELTEQLPFKVLVCRFFRNLVHVFDTDVNIT
jgi:P-type E1-E2 ATPase